MRFAEPGLLWSLVGLPLLALALLATARWRRRVVERLGDRLTLARLSSAPSPERRGLAAVLLLLGCGLLGVALARPQWGTRLEEVRRRGVDLVLAVDLSRSMLAQDVRPSRLQVAKAALGDLLDRLPQERVALVGFAGSAHVLCPLTLDHAAARIFLDVLDPSLIPEPGTAVAQALRKGIGLFEPGESKYKVLVLLTDGEDHGEGLPAAVAEAAEAGVIIHAIGVGTPAGEPIPLRDDQGRITDYVRDESGAVVTSRLDTAVLGEMARRTGGVSVVAGPGGGGLDPVVAEVERMDRKDLSSRLATNLEDRFQIPLAAALLLLSAEAALGDGRRRRGRATR